MIYAEERANGIILWEIGSVGEYIENTVRDTPFYDKFTSCVRCNLDTQPPELDENENYLLFYRSANAEEEDKARSYACENKLKVSFASLCNTDEEGIASMRKGDIYALKLPLQRQKIIQCCQHFMQLKEKENNP